MSTPAPLVLLAPPQAVHALVETLADAGHEAFLVGGCVRDALRDQPTSDFDVVTSARAEAVLRLFPHAVPIGLGHGTVMVPTVVGPVDITSYRAGPSLRADLAHRDFTINAIAFDPRTGALHDPFDGRADLAKGVLRAVADPTERLAEDPLRALRAARLAASLGFEVDSALARALPSAIRGLASVARERVRSELFRLLLAPHAGEGLALLRRSGIEASLAPGTRDDAAAVVASLPGTLELRMAGWLRGTNAASVLRGLRVPMRRSRAVEQLLRHHPIEAGCDPGDPVAVRRLLKRVGVRDALGLLALRRAELDAARPSPAREAARAALEALASAIADARASQKLELHRLDLAIDGRAVMTHLDLPAGPEVGRALRYLTDRIVEDPSRNTRARLLALLDDWHPEAVASRG